MSTPFIMDHPLIQHKISLLRDKHTGSKEFRELISEIAMFVCYEATRNLPLKEVDIETPICMAKTNVVGLCPDPARRFGNGGRCAEDGSCG